MNKISPFFSEISQQIHKMYEKLGTIAQIAQIWQRDKCYFTSMSNTSFLISGPDMKKINTFFSEKSQHAKLMKKLP